MLGQVLQRSGASHVGGELPTLGASGHATDQGQGLGVCHPIATKMVQCIGKTEGRNAQNTLIAVPLRDDFSIGNQRGSQRTGAPIHGNQGGVVNGFAWGHDGSPHGQGLASW